MREESTIAVETFRHFQERLIHGCHDRACVIKRTTGQVTNGGCNCLEDMTFMHRQYVGAMLRAAQDMADALEARPDAAQVRIKALEWKYPEHHQDCELAETIFGSYSVWETDGDGYLSKPEQHYGLHCGVGIKSAKARAQVDYENRIRAALEPDTVTGWQDMKTAPLNLQTVRLLSNEGEVDGWYEPTWGFWRDGDDNQLEPTAWRPLPPAPEKEGE